METAPSLVLTVFWVWIIKSTVRQLIYLWTGSLLLNLAIIADSSEAGAVWESVTPSNIPVSKKVEQSKGCFFLWWLMNKSACDDD
jgi:hypothetical protein